MNKLLIISILVIFYFAGCKPATEITGSWKNTNTNIAGNDIHTILVTAMTDRVNVRQTIENDLSSALEKKGYATIKSIDVIPPTFTDGKKPDREKLLSKISGTGADAILTVALIDKETETRHVPGNAAYAPLPRFSYYGTFWGYYNTWVPTLYSPGYYEEDKVYFIETNLYDAESEELLWSAQSETYNPSTLASFAEDFSEVVVGKLQEDGLLRPGTGTDLAREPVKN